MRKYDDLHQKLEAEEQDDAVSTEGVLPRPPMDPESSQSKEIRPILPPGAEAKAFEPEPIVEAIVYEPSDELPEVVYEVVEADNSLTQISPEISSEEIVSEIPEPEVDTITEMSYAELSDGEKIPSEMTAVESIFSPEEAVELDEQLAFDTDILVVDQELQEKPPTELGFVELVSTHIELMSEEQAPEVKEAKAILEVVEQLAEQILTAELAENPEKIEALKVELEVYVERLLICMKRPADVKLVQRFIERLLIDVRERQPEVEAIRDEGTHEQKQSFSRFLDDLTRVGQRAEELAQVVGSHTLTLATSQTA